MEQRRDNIYIYLWEEFSTIYIGRTINPKSRHYQHRHIVSESTYQFSSKHHVDHPKMVIIENDLTVEEGVERERYWIDYYMNNSQYYNVLNKSCGGQTGRSKLYTDEELKERERQQAKKYYESHKAAILERCKNYRNTHKEKINERRCSKNKEQKKYHEILRTILSVERDILKSEESRRKAIKKERRRIENAEKNKEYCRKYYQTHRKSSRPYKSEPKFDPKEYYRLHREKLLAKQKEYNKAHRLSGKPKD